MSPVDNISVQPPPKRKMVRRLILGALLVGAFAAFFYFISQKRPAKEAAASHTDAHQKELYYCPMHPSFRSDKPGNCPVCSMKLVKMENVPAPEKAKAAETTAMPGMPGMDQRASPPSGGSSRSIYVAPERQQLIGMRSVAVAVQPLVKEIRSVGKVAFDETKVTHIHTKVSGYIEEVFADYVGKQVRRGEPLFTIYSPDLVATQEEHLLALKSQNVLKNSSLPDIARGSSNLLAASRERLRLWDVTEEEIKRLETEGKVKKAIAVYSPVDGIVTERAAYHHGTFVDPEKELFTIVDLSRVWVLADVYEHELPFVRIGQAAEVDFPAAGAKTLHGRVSFVLPFLDPKTRTAQVRVEFSNAGFALKPDMFANIRLHSNLGNQLVVPQDAVLSTGTEQYVFLDLGQGYVEPRLVELGPLAGENYAISKGLKAGDRVVTAANFILDAESRLKGAFANMGKPTSPGTAQPVSSGDTLRIEVMQPKQAKVGANALRIFVKDSSGKPVDGADVQISIFMPQMGSMAPMSSKANLQGRGGGEYAGTLEFPMAWTWQTTITVQKAGQVIGSTQTNITAR
jgi:membrane fusion protein, copper/silver efflux system